MPFEIKYRPRGSIDLRALREFAREKRPERAYLITRDLTDFGCTPLADSGTPLVRIPAALACYWLGESEVSTHDNAP